MASTKEYLAFILDQLSDLEEITYKAMMGEYILYYRGKIVVGVYDDRLLLALLTIWGLTGIKSLIFAAYEDMILLFCGFYGMALLIKEERLRKTNFQIHI